VKIFVVTRRLAFGSAINTWTDVEALREMGFTHVLNLQRNKNTKKVRQFKWLWLPFRDNKKPRPRWFFRKALKFHAQAMRNPSSKIFVMCHHGISRSASMTYFLLRTSKNAPEKAAHLVRKARPRAKIVRAYRESGEEYLRPKAP
jgi:protein-tyrosine phosphatase